MNLMDPRYQARTFFLVIGLAGVIARPALALPPSSTHVSTRDFSGLGINRGSVNGGFDFGPRSSLQFGGSRGYDPYYDRYDNFSSGMLPRNYYPDTGMYSYLLARYSLQQPTTANLISNVFDLFLGDSGTFADRWTNFWKQGLLKPLGMKAVAAVLGRTKIDSYLSVADRYKRGLTRSGGQVLRPFQQFACNRFGQQLRGSSYSQVGDVFRHLGY